MLEFEWYVGRTFVVPGGRRNEQKLVGRVVVANVSGLADVSDYSYMVERDGKVSRLGEVLGHRRELGWEPLLARCLTQDSRVADAAAEARRWRDDSARIAENSADARMVASATSVVKAMDAVLAKLS